MIANLYIFVNITRALNRSENRNEKNRPVTGKRPVSIPVLYPRPVSGTFARAVETELFCYMYLLGLIDPAREEHPAENKQQDHENDKSDQPYGLTVATRVHIERSRRENKRYKSQ